MAYVIGGECIHCGMCASECSNFAIELNDAGNYQINAEFCQSCGICAEICPTENIAQSE